MTEQGEIYFFANHDVELLRTDPAEELKSYELLQGKIREKIDQLDDAIDDLELEISDLQDELFGVVDKKILDLKIRLGITPCPGQLALFGGAE